MSLDAALARTDRALYALGRGDPDPYRALCAPAMTLFGACGVDDLGWIAARCSGGELVPTARVVLAGADLACAVGFERGLVSIDGAERRPLTLRATQLYRRTGANWELLHRHADFPPPDERP